MTESSSNDSRSAATMAAVSRAATCVAAHYAGDNHGAALPLAQARRDGTLLLFALAAVNQAARMARAAYGDRAQFELDAWASDASFFHERETQADGRLASREDSVE